VCIKSHAYNIIKEVFDNSGNRIKMLYRLDALGFNENERSEQIRTFNQYLWSKGFKCRQYPNRTDVMVIEKRG